MDTKEVEKTASTEAGAIEKRSFWALPKWWPLTYDVGWILVGIMLAIMNSEIYYRPLSEYDYYGYMAWAAVGFTIASGILGGAATTLTLFRPSPAKALLRALDFLCKALAVVALHLAGDIEALESPVVAFGAALVLAGICVYKIVGYGKAKG